MVSKLWADVAPNFTVEVPQPAPFPVTYWIGFSGIWHGEDSPP